MHCSKVFAILAHNHVSLLKIQVNVKGSFDVGIRFNAFSYFLKTLTVFWANVLLISYSVATNQ
jgi:hypothetical protein